MIEKITEFIYELRHDPVMSERIGFLSSQQRLAANRAVDILNSRPTTSLPDLILQIIDWWRQDDRAKGQLKAMKDGAKEVWLENDRNRREREFNGRELTMSMTNMTYGVRRDSSIAAERVKGLNM